MTNRAENADRVIDPVIMEMFDRLPSVGSEWPLAERMLWLQAMEGILNMVYGPVDRIEIGEFLRKAQAEPEIVGPPKESVREAAANSGIDPDAAAAVERLESQAANNPHVKTGRPPGIPSNLEMAIEAIREQGPLTAVELREWVRAKYWQHVPAHWAATLYDYVKGNRLAREPDGERRFILREPGTPTVSVRDMRREAKQPSAPVVQAPKPPPPPAMPPLGPRPSRQPAIEFTHGDRSVIFSSSRSYALVSKLRVAMGQPIGEAFLAEKVYGSNAAANREEAKRLCLDANDKLAEVGLKVDYIAGVGLRMSEVQ